MLAVVIRLGVRLQSVCEDGGVGARSCNGVEIQQLESSECFCLYCSAAVASCQVPSAGGVYKDRLDMKVCSD